MIRFSKGISRPIQSHFVQQRGAVRHALGQLEDDREQVESQENKFLASPKSVFIVGAPMQYGQPHGGTQLGPQVLRDNGLQGTIARLGWYCTDAGDIPMDSISLMGDHPDHHCHNALNCFKVGRANQLLYEKSMSAVNKHQFLLSLGGDHSIAVGSTAALLKKYPDLGLIWVDAHADINTPDTSKSGNMHGMPVGMLMKLLGEDTFLPGFEWLKDIPTLRPEQVAYVGLRDVDDGERRMLREMREQGMFVSTMQDVDRHGIGGVVSQALESLGPDRPIHLSYDIDALDPVFAPSTGTVVRGGLTYREGHYVAEAIAETNRMVGMDIVEVNPSLDPNPENVKTTVQMALVLTASALGSRIL